MNDSLFALERTFESSHGRVAYDIVGSGEPLILIHGTPTSSYLWRKVINEIDNHWSVYLFDLPGYGQSEQFEGQDVSLKGLTKVFSELLNHWGLETPNVIGHDYGATIALRAHLLYNHTYEAMVLLDGAVRSPWVTPFSRLVREHVDVFKLVPAHIHRQLLIGHINSAVHQELDTPTMEQYLSPWLGDRGQPAYYRQVAQFNEEYTDEIEDRYSTITIPTLIIWGEEDGWLDLDDGLWLHEQIPGSSFGTVSDSGHFTPEDSPVEVTEFITEYLDRAS